MVGAGLWGHSSHLYSTPQLFWLQHLGFFLNLSSWYQLKIWEVHLCLTKDGSPLLHLEMFTEYIQVDPSCGSNFTTWWFAGIQSLLFLKRMAQHLELGLLHCNYCDELPGSEIRKITHNQPVFLHPSSLPVQPCVFLCSWCFWWEGVSSFVFDQLKENYYAHALLH